MLHRRYLFLFFTGLHFKFSASTSNESYTPIVFWHGMGDSCCNPKSLGAFMKNLEKIMPGVYIRSLRIGSSESEDVSNTYFMHPNKQISIACDIVSSDQRLKSGFNAIGISQGGQFMRGLVERCAGAKVKNLITLGAQHQGVYGLPYCPKILFKKCNIINVFLSTIASNSYIQKYWTQMTFWHNALDEQGYIKTNTFLVDINNEKKINQVYMERLSALDNFVMVLYEKDLMVKPVESSWFGFYRPRQNDQVFLLNESRIYLEDRLGLREMDLKNKLHFLSVDGGHVGHTFEWFRENIVDKFLK